MENLQNEATQRHSVYIQRNSRVKRSIENWSRNEREAPKQVEEGNRMQRSGRIIRNKDLHVNEK